MKGILCRSFSGPADLELGEIEAPAPGPDEVLIDVRASSVTFMDNLIVSGLYQMKPPLPFVCGTDAAGVVSAVGNDVTRLKPGDRVAAFHWTGAFAEQMVAKEHRTTLLPEAITFETGSAILHTYATGLYALKDRAKIQPGETLVVHGASGGVGLATVDLGRHLGARVIGTVGSDAKADLVKSYGAEHVINYQTESIRDRVKELTAERGADVIFDMVGGDVFDQSIRCINWDGRILVIGFTSGTIPKLPLNLPLLKNCSIVGVFTGLWADKFPEENIKTCDTLMAWVADGKLKPYISDVLPLARAGDALQMIADRKVTGRVVLSQS